MELDGKLGRLRDEVEVRMEGYHVTGACAAVTEVVMAVSVGNEEIGHCQREGFPRHLHDSRAGALIPSSAPFDPVL